MKAMGAAGIALTVLLATAPQRVGVKSAGVDLH